MCCLWSPSSVPDHTCKHTTNLVCADNITYRKFSCNNMESFKLAISQLTWEKVLGSHDVVEAYKLFLADFHSAIDFAFPLIKSKPTKRSNHPCKPWFSEDLKKSSCKKNKLYRKALSNPTPLNIEKYKTYKNKFTSILRNTKKKFYSEKFMQASNDSKSTWNLINDLLNRKNHP